MAERKEGFLGVSCNCEDSTPRGNKLGVFLVKERLINECRVWDGGVVSGDREFTECVVLEIVANAGDGAYDGNLEPVQKVGVADSGELEQVYGLDGAGRQDDFLAGIDGEGWRTCTGGVLEMLGRLLCTVMLDLPYLNAGGNLVRVEQYLGNLSIRQEMQVAPGLHGIIIPVLRIRTHIVLPDARHDILPTSLLARVMVLWLGDAETLVGIVPNLCLVSAICHGVQRVCPYCNSSRTNPDTLS